jgi:hypothetical protein
MNALTPSPEMSARIQQLIDALPRGSGIVNAAYARRYKEELNALPLYWRSLYLWAIRPDGVVLCVDYEPFRRPVEPEENLGNICTALFHGVRKYPDLQELFESVRPEGFQLCDECGGTGLKERGDGTDDYCWACDVRGWVTRSSRADAGSLAGDHAPNGLVRKVVLIPEPGRTAIWPQKSIDVPSNSEDS